MVAFYYTVFFFNKLHKFIAEVDWIYFVHNYHVIILTDKPVSNKKLTTVIRTSTMNDDAVECYSK